MEEPRTRREKKPPREKRMHTSKHVRISEKQREANALKTTNPANKNPPNRPSSCET